MDDDKTLADYGLTSTAAKAQTPSEVGLAFMMDGTWEELEKCPYSSPPELPDVMKPGQESTAQETATA
jgi:transcription elongation factor B subunit 2